MKDEHDKYTAEIISLGAADDSARARRERDGHPAAPKRFNPLASVTDEQTFGAPKPKEAKIRPTMEGSAFGAYFVPVSFAAKDWDVTPRRIRALLADGRLAGQVQPNGYWEVRFPYQFTFGTRGPTLKRQQRPKKQERRAA